MTSTFTRRRTALATRYVRWFLRIYILVSASALALGLLQLRDAVDSEQWTGSTGTVTRTWRGVDTGIPHLTYQYQVGGNTYEGHRIRFRPLGADEAGNVLRRYAKGRQVRVFHDPDDPQHSVLEPGWRWTDHLLPLLVPSFLIFLGGFFYLHHAGRERQDRRAADNVIIRPGRSVPGPGCELLLLVALPLALVLAYQYGRDYWKLPSYDLQLQSSDLGSMPSDKELLSPDSKAVPTEQREQPPRGEVRGGTWRTLLERGKALRGDQALDFEDRQVQALNQYRLALAELEQGLANGKYGIQELRELFNEISGVLLTLRRYDELETYARKKVRLYARYVGPDRTLTGSAWEGLGHALVRLGRKQEAAMAYEKAKAIYHARGREQAVARIQNRIDGLGAPSAGKPQPAKAVIERLEPPGCLRPEQEFRVLGEGFGPPAQRGLFLGGNGISVPVLVLSWFDQQLHARFPTDPRIEAGKGYYVGIQDRKRTRWLSNLKGFRVCPDSP